MRGRRGPLAAGTDAGPWSRPKRSWSRLLELERTSLVTAVSLLVVLLNAGGGRPLLVAMLAATVAGLFSPKLRTSAAFWLAVAAIWGVHLWLHRFTADNHKYLTFYWCLAVALSLWSGSPGETMARNGRLLVGLTFLFATTWKLASPDFLTGDFFHYHLLVDPRLWPLTEALGGLEPEQLARNAELQARLALPGGPEAVQLSSSPAVDRISRAMGVGATALELGVAGAFLAPRTWLSPVARSVVLWIFAAATYLMVPVMGFGTLLLTLGLAQLRPSDRRARAVYLVLLLAGPLYLFLWRGLVA